MTCGRWADRARRTPVSEGYAGGSPPNRDATYRGGRGRARGGAFGGVWWRLRPDGDADIAADFPNDRSRSIGHAFPWPLPRAFPDCRYRRT
jgi:hypothetical protein